MKDVVSAAFGSILFASFGCSGSTPSSPICTSDIRAGILVYVKDSATNVGAASGASLIVREGTFKDSIAAPNDGQALDNAPLQAATERAGTYQITVSKPGYAIWSRSHVLVTKNECHVNTVRLTALLQPNT